MDRGEPAYPSTRGLATGNGKVVEGHPGMTLRDHFAGAALPVAFQQMDIYSDQFLAERAYEIADAMMEARKP